MLQKYKNPSENYVALKTPSLHGKHSESGAKEWKFYFPRIFILEFIANNAITIQVRVIH